MEFNMDLNVGMKFLARESGKRRGKKEKELSIYVLKFQNTEIIAYLLRIASRRIVLERSTCLTTVVTELRL